MLKVSNSQRYKQELQEFESKISKIKIASAKTKANTLLRLLKEQISLINEGHASSNDGNLQLTSLRDNVMKLTDLRRELSNFLKHVK